MTTTCPDCGYRIDHANAGHVAGCKGAVVAPPAPYEGWARRPLPAGPLAISGLDPEPAAPAPRPVLDPPGSGR